MRLHLSEQLRTLTANVVTSYWPIPPALRESNETSSLWLFPILSSTHGIGPMTARSARLGSAQSVGRVSEVSRNAQSARSAKRRSTALEATLMTGRDLERGDEEKVIRNSVRVRLGAPNNAR